MESISSTLEKFGVRAFWYLAHLQNLPSILARGILSYSDVWRLNVDHERIDSRSTQQERQGSRRCGDETFFLHDRVPLFFATHQPMLYVQKSPNTVAHLEMTVDVFGLPGAMFSDGNAAKRQTEFFTDPGALAGLDWKVIWTSNCYSTEWKRRKAAELLLPSPVPPEYVWRVHVRDQAALEAAARLLPNFESRIIVSPALYWI